MGRGPSIEARKNATDAQRGKIFTKSIREISVAARAGGDQCAGEARAQAACGAGDEHATAGEVDFGCHGVQATRRSALGR